MDDGTPLWKKALMRKRAAEQKKKDDELARKVTVYIVAERERSCSSNEGILQWAWGQQFCPLYIERSSLSRRSTNNTLKY